MFLNRMARAALLKRGFHFQPALRGLFQLTKADIVTELYLKEIKQYKAPTAAKIDLPTSFATPVPPVVPALEQKPEALKHAELAADEWPALEDPVDNPELYNYEYDISTENDDGSLFPRRVVPIDYEHHH